MDSQDLTVILLPLVGAAWELDFLFCEELLGSLM